MDELQAKIVAGRKAVMAADESISREEAKLFGHGIHRGCQFFQKRLTTLPPDRRLHLSTPAPISQRVFDVVNVTVSRHDRSFLKSPTHKPAQPLTSPRLTGQHCGHQRRHTQRRNEP